MVPPRTLWVRRDVVEYVYKNHKTPQKKKSDIPQNVAGAFVRQVVVLE
jgi:hypothetical protein